jgi:hypothetical protein
MSRPPPPISESARSLLARSPGPARSSAGSEQKLSRFRDGDRAVVCRIKCCEHGRHRRIKAKGLLEEFA